MTSATTTMERFSAMGTMVSLRSETELTAAAVRGVRECFESLEARFSRFRAGSEADLVARGLVPLRRTSTEFRAVYDQAVDWRQRTGGAFTPHRPDSTVDLTGIVKAVAIDRAGALLRALGYADWCLNAGGDVLTAGSQHSGEAWQVGIVDPDDRSALLTAYTVDAKHPAVATSGISERGEHIWRVGADATFRQVSVAAADILTADVLATAILAGGPGALQQLSRDWKIEVIASAGGEKCWATPAFLG